ncbi:MAG TPA: YqzL family protein [Virgibacillus sp.]|nr:YqzL family protein [Virgibacillus sp.]
MLDITWKLFTQTGNIEAYLLLKELEEDPNQKRDSQLSIDDTISFRTEM